MYFWHYRVSNRSKNVPQQYAQQYAQRCIFQFCSEIQMYNFMDVLLVFICILVRFKNNLINRLHLPIFLVMPYK